MNYEWFMWAGLAAFGVLMVAANAETVSVEWVGNGSDCVVSGYGIVGDQYVEECWDDFEIEVSEDCLDTLVRVPYDCNYTDIYDKITVLNHTSTCMCPDYNGNITDVKGSLKTYWEEEQSWVKEQVVDELKAEMDVVDENRNLTLTLASINSSLSSTQTANGLLNDRINELQKDRDIWQLAALAAFCGFILVSPLGTGILRKAGVVRG